MEQTDIHSPHSTVHEAIMFSAYLRQGSSISNEVLVRFVDEVMNALELETIQDKEIGTQSSGGLSTHESKIIQIFEMQF